MGHKAGNEDSGKCPFSDVQPGPNERPKSGGWWEVVKEREECRGEGTAAFFSSAAIQIGLPTTLAPKKPKVNVR